MSRERSRPVRRQSTSASSSPPRSSAGHRRPPTFRWLAIVAIPAILIGAGLIDQAEDRPTTGLASTVLGPAAQLPTAFPAAAVGTAWYCAGGTATEGAAADHEVFLFNPSGRAATVTVTAFPSVGATGQRTVQVGPKARASVRLADLVDAPYAAASVESENSQVVVEQRVSRTARVRPGGVLDTCLLHLVPAGRIHRLRVRPGAGHLQPVRRRRHRRHQLRHRQHRTGRPHPVAAGLPGHGRAGTVPGRGQRHRQGEPPEQRGGHGPRHQWVGGRRPAPGLRRDPPAGVGGLLRPATR